MPSKTKRIEIGKCGRRKNVSNANKLSKREANMFKETPAFSVRLFDIVTTLTIIFFLIH